MAELKTFVFTDISGSVRLKDEMTGRSVTERDQAFITSILTPHRQRIEARLADFGGRVVSTAGDGHFLVFDHTVQAAQWAVTVQESHRDDPIVTPAGEHVEVRMSMHVGVPQIDPGDPSNFVGKTVDYAARLNDYATGGQILVSRSVMAILDDVGLEGVKLHMHGRKSLKGIGNVEVHEILYDDHGPRPMRNQPKHNIERQWTVVPTQMGETAPGQLATTVAGGTALKRVGNYELEEVLGSGGMGDVYKARHSQFGRVRAVKVIKQQFVTSGHTEVINRFYNEIKAVGRLEHKNIVVAIDSSLPTDQVHYLVMEYIAGVSLDELVHRHGPLPIAEACEIIRQAARGLQYIHKNGMVHRDIKPSNLMVTLVEGESLPADSSLTEQGEGERAVVKILDLGLALLAVDNSDRLTRFDHKAMGTGMYMPPEQWKTTSVDIRADIYSLGCTLYHLLEGNPPFYDSDLRPEKAHEKSPVPPIRSSMQPLPKKLWDVLRKMLEKRPEDRYATPAEVSAALAPFAEGHDLASLVRRYESAETVTGAMTPTKPNGISKIDTHKSRPRYGRDAAGPTRRWLARALPLLLIAAFTGGAAWLLYAAGEQRRSELEAARIAAFKRAESDAKETLSSFAEIAAKRDMPTELAKRFDTLVAEAANEEMIEIVHALNNTDPDANAEQYNKLLGDLRQWLIHLPDTYGEEIVVESWFIQDKRGKQIARSPQDPDSFLKDYWYRDYFHGQGKDLDKTDESLRSAIKPNDRIHLSSVYRSTTSGLLKVAFSVPIRREESRPDGTPGPLEVIGVLAMSTNVHEFTVLEKGMAGGSEVVLIDLRNDWVEGEPKRGLILHHPRLEKGRLARVDAELLKKIDAAEPLKRADFNGDDFFQVGYRDPLSVKPDQKYWGVFEPVRYAINKPAEGEEQSERFGWLVLVQKPMAE
jgi:serine/threonine protein kinase/class 3 adenylate cyclase